MANPLLVVIVLSHHQSEDTFSCLQSLTKNDYKNFKVILLETASATDELAGYRSRFPQIQIVALPENLGYAGNNNLGIHLALEQGAEWILILNNDTILDPVCLSTLVEACDSDPAIGIAGPIVYHFDEPHVIQSAGGVFGKYWQNVHLGKNEVDRGQFKSPSPVQWISGCAIMVRRAVMEQIGLLAEDYFMYWEEIEFCIRASNAGWKIMQVPDAKLWHKGVQRDYQPKPSVTYYSTRNYLYTLARYKAPWLVRTAAIANILRTLLSWSLKTRWRNKRDHRDAMWRGLLDFVRHRMGPMIP